MRNARERLDEALELALQLVPRATRVVERAQECLDSMIYSQVLTDLLSQKKEKPS